MKHVLQVVCIFSSFFELGSSSVGIPWTQSIFQVQMQIVYQKDEEGYLEVRGKWILKRLSARILIIHRIFFQVRCLKNF